MSTLTGCDLGSVEQAAWVLAQCADRAADATAACQRAGRATWRWRGPAQRSFDASLGDLQQRFTQIAAAHEEAAGVIRQYVGALALAADRARTAEAMDREADALSAPFRRAAAAAAAPLSGPDPGEALRAHAARLRGEAVSQEGIAASIAAAQLDGLARRAPRPPRLAGMSRFTGDLAGAVGGSVLGLAQLGVLAGEALGVGNREPAARGELWRAAKDTAKVWQPFADMWHDGTGGRPGLAVAGVVGVLGPGKVSKLGNFPVRDIRLAHLEALREADVRADLAGYREYLDTAKSMGTDGVELINQELRGGHVMLRHVSAEDEYLLARNATGVDRAGTFLNLGQAERFVNEVLRRNATRLPEIYTSGQPLRLVEGFDEPTGRVALADEGRTVLAYRVRVILRLKGGEPYVFTAFPEL